MNNLIDQLESRRMLSVTLNDGLLVVEGSAKNNLILIKLKHDGSSLTVHEGLRRPGNMMASAKRSTFNAADVTAIVVNANAGNDIVHLLAKRASEFDIPVTINGGSGDDKITSAGGDDLLNGDAGDDRISGGAGADIVNGGSGDDRIHGNGGADYLYGNDGDDRLTGGTGVDTLNGGTGDDRFHTKGDKAVDIVDGGTDSAGQDDDDQDFVIADVRDALSDIVTNATIRNAPNPGDSLSGRGR